MLAEQLSFALGSLRLREALREQSVRDGLTGLFNRRYLEETIEREIARARRKSQPLATVMLDLDHFKRINDTFGHDAGDAVLRSLARVLMAGLRGSDIVCRYGGEEFVVLMPEASLDAARERAEALRLDVARMHVVHNGAALGPLSVSAGVAVYPEHGVAPEALLGAADKALYEAKRSGRNRVVCAAGGPGAQPGSATLAA